MLSSAQVDAIERVLGARFPGLRAAWVYGSAASARMRPDSDVDLAVAVTPPPDPKDLFDAQLALERELERDVDLVVIDRVSPILGMQVLKTGERLLTMDATAAAAVEARVFTAYHDFKRIRRAAEAALEERFSGG